MTDQPLSGARVAVLVESQFIPGELRIYQERFAGLGATVDLVSRLWGQPSLRFYSTIEPDGDGNVPPIEWIEVGLDVDQVDLSSYDAVIATANYTSVRLRYVDPPATAESAMQDARSAPAIRFFRRAMADPRLVKVAPCHALWLLTPSPDVLAGRRVTCNPVVLADVVNAGATYVPPAPGQPDHEQIVVDGDLVTSTSWHATENVVNTVKDMIIERRQAAAAGMPAGTAAGMGSGMGAGAVSMTGSMTGTAAGSGASVGAAPAARAAAGAETTPFGTELPYSGGRPARVLVVVSEWGYWGEELVGPLGVFDEAGYSVTICTPTGKRPNAIPVSMDPDFFDPALQRPVTTETMARRVRELDDPGTSQGARLESPLDLSSWFPQRPYFSAPNFVRQLEAYNRDLERAEREVAERFDAILIVGGSGPLVDLANNQRVHDLILAFHKLGRPIAAECYGVTCLAFARDMNERRSIIAGKNVTGHCLEYDYQDGTAFVESRGKFLDFNMGPPPYPLEYILRDATAMPDGNGNGNGTHGEQGGYHGNFGHPTSVIVDYPFITGRSTPDSILTGQKLVEVLDGGLKRWGW